MNIREVPPPTRQRRRKALRPSINHHVLREPFHRREPLVVKVNQLLCLGPAKPAAQLVRQSKIGHAIKHRVVQQLRITTLILSRLLGPEHNSRRRRVNILAILKRRNQSRLAAHMSKHPKLDLRIVKRRKRITFGGNKRFPNRSTQLSPNRNILQVRIVGRKPPCRRRRLRVRRMNSTVGANLRLQGIRIS